MRFLLLIILWVLTPQGLQIGEVFYNNQIIKIMKMNLKNPAFLQSAGSAREGGSGDFFYVISNEDGNEISFDDTRLGYFAENVQYSTDNCNTWEQLTSDLIITLNSGDAVYFRNYTGDIFLSREEPIVAIRTSKAYNIGGDIISLFYPKAEAEIVELAGAFVGDENLVDASALRLPTITLYTEGCYYAMFFGCSSLTTAPELPATTLSEGCYHMMFALCSSLTTAPELPATTLAYACYYQTFFGCSSLTTAPELPATTLSEGCYVQMFAECINLSSVKCLTTDIPTEKYTGGWLSNVSPTGTFTKATGVDWPTGDFGIPTGWTVIEQ